MLRFFRVALNCMHGMSWDAELFKMFLQEGLQMGREIVTSHGVDTDINVIAFAFEQLVSHPSACEAEHDRLLRFAISCAATVDIFRYRNEETADFLFLLRELNNGFWASHDRHWPRRAETVFSPFCMYVFSARGDNR